MLGDDSRERGDTTPVKQSFSGPGNWRHKRIRTTDHELDDVAFLTGSMTSRWEKKS